MFRKPSWARLSNTREELIGLMRRLDLRHVPLLDDQGRVAGLETLMDLVQERKLDNWVVLMAGGLGTRLAPLTENCPKPLLKVGDKPILETILEKFLNCGLSRFFISVNYMADMIEKHFGDGSRWNASITYVREKRRMGTAGALGLLPERPEKPFFVMNGDLLTLVDFRRVLDFHADTGSVATMCVREYEVQVPFGVVRMDGERISGLEEKPVHNFFVNAGIYVLDPMVLDLIEADVFFDMPELFAKLINAGKPVSGFPLREYWMDIGRLDDLRKANGDYDRLFCNNTQARDADE